jgi:hypothetical protein
MEWTFGPAEPAFGMMKDPKIDKQINKATEPTKHKPHEAAKRDEERVMFVAKALYHFENGNNAEFDAEDLDIYEGLARASIQAIKDFAQSH